MTEVNGAIEKPNGVSVEVVTDEEDDSKMSSKRVHHHQQEEEEVTLYGLLNRLIASTFSPNQDSSYSTTPLLHRIKDSISETVPLFQPALRNTGRDVLLWTRRGSPLRAILVVSVGTITLLALTGLLIFMLFFIAATINAIVISLLISLAAVGGFLAVFFACVTAVYIGALFIAVSVISTLTISAIVAALIAAGWIGFFWMVWLAATKSATLAKHSWSITVSAISAYSSAQHVGHPREPVKVSD